MRPATNKAPQEIIIHLSFKLRARSQATALATTQKKATEVISGYSLARQKPERITFNRLF
jgi:hypothetical protein